MEEDVKNHNSRIYSVVSAVYIIKINDEVFKSGEDKSGEKIVTLWRTG